VRVRIHDGRAVVFIQSEEISQIRYTQRLDQAVTFGLQSYLAGFNLPAQLEFRYTDVTITAPEPERPDASDEVKIYGIGPRAEQAIAELFPRSAINRRMKSIPALSSFKTTMPYTRRGSLLPINICFIDGGGRFLEAAEALSSALPAGNTIAVINAGDLSGVNRPGVLADIYRSSFRNLAIFRHEPIWRDGMISTPNLSTLYHQFFRTFTASLLRLEAGGRSRGSTSIFTFAYMGGGIRNLEGAISRCISSGANGIYPLHQSRSGSLVVTTVARLNSAYQWQAKRAVSRNLPIREDDVEVGSWRLTSDQYGNASSVAFLSDGIGDGEYATGAVSPDEIEIVLKGCGTNYQHDNNVDRHFFRIFFDGNELALFCGNEPPSSLHLVPAIVVRDHNFIPSGARRTVNSDIEVPISALSLVLLSSDPMRMARFLDFYLYRDRPEWLFSETERLLKDRFGRLRPDQLGFRLPKRDGEISMDQLGVSFKLPSLRRNYEIAISGSCEVFVKGVMKKKRKTSVVVFRASFSLLHRPTYEPRWLKFEMGPVSEL
jgi:hypothetical protein